MSGKSVEVVVPLDLFLFQPPVPPPRLIPETTYYPVQISIWQKRRLSPSSRWLKPFGLDRRFRDVFPRRVVSSPCKALIKFPGLLYCHPPPPSVVLYPAIIPRPALDFIIRLLNMSTRFGSVSGPYRLGGTSSNYYSLTRRLTRRDRDRRKKRPRRQCNIMYLWRVCA